MKVAILDELALKSLASHDVLSFLTFHDWIVTSTEPGFRTVLRKESREQKFEVVVPLDETLGDYAQAIGRVVESVANALNVSQLEVFHRIQAIGSDVVRIRAAHDSYSDGTIPLNAGTALFEASRSMFLAAALATDEPRAAYRGNRPTQVEDFIRDARLGQTEVGSYVITMRTRITPTLFSVDSQLQFSEDGSENAIVAPPFERRVTETLIRALKATKDAIGIASATHDSSPFELAVRNGVSANLLDSIVALTEKTGAIEADIEIGWSPTRAPTQNTPTKVRFLQSEAGTLKEASRILREREPNENFEVEGYVVGLESEAEEAPHIVTIRALVEGKHRKIRVNLTASDYSVAADAHLKYYVVQCEGKLVRNARQYELQTPRNFRLYNEEPPLPFED